MLKDDARLRHARHANACARRLSNAIADVPGVSFAAPVEANGVFLNLSAAAQERLRARGWHFYGFIGGASRFIFAWDSQIEQVNALAREIRACALPTAA